MMEQAWPAVLRLAAWRSGLDVGPGAQSTRQRMVAERENGRNICSAPITCSGYRG
jgi:hypothetical protein